MATLESMLFEAAAAGNVKSLQKLLQEDPLILDRVVVSCFHETPVHIAALLGHIGFVREILRRKPEFARELNSHLSSPLHLASAKGYAEVARALISVNAQMCLVCDKNGFTPLHLASIKGRIDVMKELLRAEPDAARVVLDRGQTILHLCVKHYQLESLKLLVETIGDQVFTNFKDSDGNSVLHWAVAYKQVETVNFLLTGSIIDVNERNLSGMTAMDVLIQSRIDVRDEEIEESLQRAGAFGSMENDSQVHTNRNRANRGSSSYSYHPPSSSNMQKNSLQKMPKQYDDWLDKKRSALMVVASLIATIAFQVGVNPPSGVWQDSQGNPVSVSDPRRAGFSIFAYYSPAEYKQFMILNTTGFIASLSIILLLMSGLPLRHRIFMWILMVVTWIAITAIALTYVCSLTAISSGGPGLRSEPLLVRVVIIWAGLMAFLLLGHTIRLTVRILKKLLKLLGPKPRIPRSGVMSHGRV